MATSTHKEKVQVMRRSRNSGNADHHWHNDQFRSIPRQQLKHFSTHQYNFCYRIPINLKYINQDFVLTRNVCRLVCLFTSQSKYTTDKEIIIGDDHGQSESGNDDYVIKFPRWWIHSCWLDSEIGPVLSVRGSTGQRRRSPGVCTLPPQSWVIM